MIPYYEELNDEEKNAVTKVIRTLLKQTFVLERKYDKKSIYSFYSFLFVWNNHRI